MQKDVELRKALESVIDAIDRVLAANECKQTQRPKLSIVRGNAYFASKVDHSARKVTDVS